MKTKNQNREQSWETIQENLADKTGLAVIIVQGEESETVSKSNNNSICEMLYNSVEFAPKCAMFCGKAVEIAAQAGKSVPVKCHADLNFYTVPIKLNDTHQTAAIVGRTFLKSEDYRNAATRAMTGDWQQFPLEQLFKNVLLASSDIELEKAAKSLENLSQANKDLLLEKLTENEPEIDKDASKNLTEPAELKSQAAEISEQIEKFNRKYLPQIIDREITERNSGETEELAAWRSLFGSLLELNYKDACVSVLRFLSKRFDVLSLAWLERKNNNFESVGGSGKFKGQQLQIPVPADDSGLFEAIKKEIPLEFRERKDVANNGDRQNINLFPIGIGSRVQSAVIIGDKLSDDYTKKHISRFLRNVASELEILRLREQIERQSWTTKAIQKLNETIKQIDTEDFWTILAQVSAELMQAERGSLMLFDDTSKEFLVKAAIGSRADFIKKENPAHLGERVAQNVLRSGRPLVINDTGKAGLKTPSEWNYKTNSFISYPIVISGRKIGVLNITDKIDGGSYNETDLELLHTLIPQIAVAIDRSALLRKAGEYEQLSITDSLTGLVNRRYLEERLAEEIKRSQRDGYPLSFMMIDADTFKNYNDTYGHTAGDRALQIVGQCLKSTLRGADVAARYGGEEFSILLPQTTLNEAITIAERLRQKIEMTPFPNRQVTVSIGVSTCSKSTCNSEELITGADKALYEAKRNGRNNVQVHHTQSPENDAV